MPREIIDTKSSRPQYVRRRVLQTIVVVLVLIAVFVGLEYAGVLHLHLGAAIGFASVALPGNSGP